MWRFKCLKKSKRRVRFFILFWFIFFLYTLVFIYLFIIIIILSIIISCLTLFPVHREQTKPELNSF